MSEVKPPIFLLGNVRSGTSMLHDLFDLHPEVVSWYEPRTVWMYAAPARKHDRFDAKDATPRVRRYIRKRYLNYQRKHGNLRVMEKTPSNLFRIPYVRTIFPESKYLYIVRDPLAYLSSSELKWQTPISLRQTVIRFLEAPKTQLPYYAGRFIRDNVRSRILRRKYVSVWGVRYPGIYEDLRTMTPAEVIAKQWVACVRQAEEDLAAIEPDRILRMRYEDFVDAPVRQFERILNHFDLEFTNEMARIVSDRVDPNRRSKWKRLDLDILRDCAPILRDEMERSGYAWPDPAHSGSGTGTDPATEHEASLSGNDDL